MVAFEQRFVIECVHLGRPAMHEEKDDAPGPRREKRRLSRKRIKGGMRGLHLSFTKQARECQISKPGRRYAEHLTAREDGCELMTATMFHKHQALSPKTAAEAFQSAT